MNTINDFRKKIGKTPLTTRLEMCEFLSRNRMMKNAPKPPNMINTKIEPFNHELEMIGFNSVLVENRKGYDEDPLKWLKSCTRFIRSQEFLTEQTKQYGALTLFSALGFTQFEGQQHFEPLYYRFNYLFNFQSDLIDMKAIFHEKFGLSFGDLQKTIMQLHLWSIMNRPEITADIFLKKRLKHKYSKLLSFLTKDRNEFIIEYNEITADDDFFSFLDLNLLLKYPIIKYDNKLYIPYVPYVIYAATKSLMFRITEGNNDLRSLIGKNVIESYVGNILRKSLVTNKFDIIDEFFYENGKKSSDFIIQSQKQILFIEVKFFNQGLKLRRFDSEVMKEVFQKLAGYILQVYRNIIHYDKNDMNHKLISNLKTNGIVVIYDEFLFIKEKIYDIALHRINSEFKINLIKEDITDRILLMSLSSLEKILKDSKEDIFEYFNSLIANKKSYLDLPYGENVLADRSQIVDYDEYISSIYNISEKEFQKYWNLD